MKKFTTLLLAFIFIFGSYLRADEGMWLLALIGKNYQQMKALGLKITPEDIYSINHSSLKDAVVALDHGSCTAEIVSPNGLLFTNHHCGYGEIQAHSTVEHNYLKDGFWANSYDEELPNPGKTASFLIEMKDVTKDVLQGISEDMSETMRKDLIKQNIDKLEKEREKGTDYDVEIKSMFDGNQYFMFVYEVYKDIRLVGAPPSSIGKYGGDTDNWMWPRHTGDFSIFRIYTAPDGSPAEYSPDNVPLKPKKYLKVNISGLKEGDYTMIMGYPGSTNRYLTAYEVKEVMNHENKIRIDVRTQKLNILKKYMDSDPKLKIAYAAKYAQSANYWKYSIGQNLGLKRLKVIKRKKQTQKEIMKWIKQDPKRKEKYANIFKEIKKGVKDRSKADIAMNYWFEAIYLGSEIVQFGLENWKIYQALQQDNVSDSLIDEYKQKAHEFFKDYDPKVDKDLFVNLGKKYYHNIDKQFYGDIYKSIQSDYDKDINKYADAIYSSSILTDSTKYNDFLKNPNYDVLANDMGFNYAITMVRTYYKIKDAKDASQGDFDKARRLYMEAYIQTIKSINPDTLYYPDANSTMRLTYGTVGGYTYDGKTYKYYSTIDGYMAKEDPNNEEFNVSDRMKELYKKKDYGQYADKDGTLHIDFLTNNDITGGNSGSPVLNANGELVGLAFDGNWEGMSGDIAYEPNLQKTICVDIRFVLWTIDKYAGCHRLIDELNLVK